MKLLAKKLKKYCSFLPLFSCLAIAFSLVQSCFVSPSPTNFIGNDSAVTNVNTFISQFINSSQLANLGKWTANNPNVNDFCNPKYGEDCGDDFLLNPKGLSAFLQNLFSENITDSDMTNISNSVLNDFSSPTSDLAKVLQQLELGKEYNVAFFATFNIVVFLAAIDANYTSTKNHFAVFGSSNPVNTFNEVFCGNNDVSYHTTDGKNYFENLFNQQFYPTFTSKNLEDWTKDPHPEKSFATKFISPWLYNNLVQITNSHLTINGALSSNINDSLFPTNNNNNPVNISNDVKITSDYFSSLYNDNVTSAISSYFGKILTWRSVVFAKINKQIDAETSIAKAGYKGYKHTADGQKITQPSLPGKTTYSNFLNYQLEVNSFVKAEQQALNDDVDILHNQFLKYIQNNLPWGMYYFHAGGETALQHPLPNFSELKKTGNQNQVNIRRTKTLPDFMKEQKDINAHENFSQNDAFLQINKLFENFNPSSQFSANYDVNKQFITITGNSSETTIKYFIFNQAIIQTDNGTYWYVTNDGNHHKIDFIVNTGLTNAKFIYTNNKNQKITVSFQQIINTDGSPSLIVTTTDDHQHVLSKNEYTIWNIGIKDNSTNFNYAIVCKNLLSSESNIVQNIHVNLSHNIIAFAVRDGYLKDFTNPSSNSFINGYYLIYDAKNKSFTFRDINSYFHTELNLILAIIAGVAFICASAVFLFFAIKFWKKRRMVTGKYKLLNK